MDGAGQVYVLRKFGLGYRDHRDLPLDVLLGDERKRNESHVQGVLDLRVHCNCYIIPAPAV